MAESFPIGIRNDLLTAEHYEMIGAAIWVYMWLYDRVTDEYQTDTGETRGRVLGGSVVKARDIAGTFGISEQTVRHHIKALKLARYIAAGQTGDGFRIEVRNSRKWPPKRGSETDRTTERQSDRTTEQQNDRVTQNHNSTDLTFCQSRVPSNNDIAVRQDNAEDIRGGGGTHAREATDHRWEAAVVAACTGLPPEYLGALRGCQVLRVDRNDITVALPVGEEERRLVRRVLPRLQGLLYRTHKLNLALQDPSEPIEARAGP